jgi:undecaprenol kinase/diacylglycerol kinase (ATP)
MKFIRKVIKSFGYAFAGIKFFLGERNIKIHIFVALLAIVSGFIFSIDMFEWIAVIFCISIVISLEIINTMIEEVIDYVCSVKNGKAMIIKDLAAAAVLVSAISSVIIGLIIFVPKIIKLLQ